MALNFSYQTALPLSDADSPFDRTWSTMKRIELGDGAWIDRQPRWCEDADQLFLTVAEALDWREGVEHIRGSEIARPRLVATFPRESLPTGLEVVNEMSHVLSERYGLLLDRVTCNLYRDGRDSVAWHGDRVARDLPEATVAVLSLGEARPFKVRPKGGGSSIGWAAGRGDLIVMGGSCQRTHDHAVPKVAKAGPRIAVMFRPTY